MTVLSIPVIIIFYQYGGMNYMKPISLTQLTSFGNMGFDTANCQKDVININSTYISMFL